MKRPRVTRVPQVFTIHILMNMSSIGPGKGTEGGKVYRNTTVNTPYDVRVYRTLARTDADKITLGRMSHASGDIVYAYRHTYTVCHVAFAVLGAPLPGIKLSDVRQVARLRFPSYRNSSVRYGLFTSEIVPGSYSLGNNARTMCGCCK